MKTFMPTTNEEDRVWSGLVGDLYIEALPAAIWQNVAMGGVSVIEYVSIGWQPYQ